MSTAKRIARIIRCIAEDTPTQLRWAWEYDIKPAIAGAVERADHAA